MALPKLNIREEKKILGWVQTLYLQHGRPELIQLGYIQEL